MKNTSYKPNDTNFVQECQWYFAKFHLKDILSQEAIILIICGENSKIPYNLIFLKVKFLESKQRLQASTIY